MLLITSAWLSSLSLAPFSPAVASVKLAPHRAVYDMKLERNASGSGISELTGRMVYEITGDTCQGYTQNTRFVTRSIDQSGQLSVMDLRSKFWEDGLGQTFKFDTDYYQNEKLSEKSTGVAKRDDGLNKVKVRISKPKQTSLDLSHKTLFPIQHTLHLLKAAQNGNSIFIADIYDGSEKGEKIYETTAIVGGRKTNRFASLLPPIKSDKALEGLAAWPISLAYFERQEERSDSLPTYELRFMFYENGVARNLLIDYGHFAIRGQLTVLDMLKNSNCKK